jgi:hypothetical protein
MTYTQPAGPGYLYPASYQEPRITDWEAMVEEIVAAEYEGCDQEDWDELRFGVELLDETQLLARYEAIHSYY